MTIMLCYRNKLFKCKHALLQKSRSCTTEFNTVQDLVTEYFELSTVQAKNFIEKEKLLSRSRDCNGLIESIKFCEEIGFDKKSILGNPALLRCHYITLDQRYNVLKEGGFNVISPTVLSRFLKYSRCHVMVLKKQGLISESTNVSTSFLNNLTPRPNQSYKFENKGLSTFIWIHFKILVKYLAWQLEASLDTIDTMASIHKPMCNKSLKYLCENLKFAKDLGFNSEKIINNGYILHSYPKYWKTIMNQYPTVAGVPIKKVMRMHPRITGIQPSHIGEVYNLLKKYNISEEAIRKKMGVFLLKPATIDQRLQELTRLPEFQVFHNNPNVLELVLHMGRAKSRLSSLKELQLRCFGGVTVLAKQESVFEDYVKENRDTNSISVLKVFLKKLFKADISKSVILLKRHPFYRQIPLVDIEDSYLFLKEEEFTNDSILRVIFVLLYSRNKLKQAFKQLKNHEQWSRIEMDEVKMLNLAVYFIEQEHHFTGDGVWVKPEILDT